MGHEPRRWSSACQVDTGVGPPSRLGGGDDHDADVAEMGCGAWLRRVDVATASVVSGRDLSARSGNCVGRAVETAWAQLLGRNAGRGGWKVRAAAIAVYYESVYRSLVSLEGAPGIRTAYSPCPFAVRRMPVSRPLHATSAVRRVPI